jgi:hypothetical protein
MDDREQSCPGSLPDPGWGAYAAWLDGGLRFGQGDGADVLPPGPLLAGLTEEAVQGFGVLPDDELVGVLQAARRQEVRESYKQVLVIAEFARRREAAFEAARARGVPVGCRAGGFPGEELAIELVTTPVQAGHRIETATDLVTRLPATLAGMAAGLIDEPRAAWIAYYTHGLARPTRPAPMRCWPPPRRACGPTRWRAGPRRWRCGSTPPRPGPARSTRSARASGWRPAGRHPATRRSRPGRWTPPTRWPPSPTSTRWRSRSATAAWTPRSARCGYWRWATSPRAATPWTASGLHPPKTTRPPAPRSAQGSPETRPTPRPTPAAPAPTTAARTRGQGGAVTQRTAPGTTARQAKTTTLQAKTTTRWPMTRPRRHAARSAGPAPCRCPP